MLREEVLREWGRLNEKLATVCLTPKEKNLYQFLEQSKTTSFITTGFSGDLDEAQAIIRAENQKCDELEVGENELLTDYWLIWYKLNYTIVDWIDSRKLIRSLRQEEENLIQFRCWIIQQILGEVDPNQVSEEEILRALHNFKSGGGEGGPTIEEVD